MKKNCLILFKELPKLAICAFAAALFILEPKVAAQGVKNGLSLLAADVIPALFPLTAVASYVSLSGATLSLGRMLSPIGSILFKVGSGAFLPIVAGLFGGYPVGAKTVSEQYQKSIITKNEAERLMYFCVNSSPAFTVSAVGVMCFGRVKTGLLLFGAIVLSSLTLGIFGRFLDDGERIPTINLQFDTKHAFSRAIASSTEAILSIAGWILVFSVIANFTDSSALSKEASLFLKSVCEVTTGCKATAGIVPLQLTAAMLGFGGFAVICQISPYVAACGIEMKRIFASRVINASLCAFYTTLLLKIFPNAVTASATPIGTSGRIFLSQTAPCAVFLMLMCAAFILEVDNRRKVC